MKKQTKEQHKPFKKSLKGKTKEKVHFFIFKDGKIRYLCNQACSISKGKYTNDFFSITCNNCKGILVRTDIKQAELKGYQQAQKDHLKNKCIDCKYYKKECDGCNIKCEHSHKKGCLNYYCAFRLIKKKKIKGVN